MLNNNINKIQESPLQNETQGPRLSSRSIRCRICLDSCDMGELISPCFCKGSIGLIHKNCLERWLTAAKIGKCEICGYEFFLQTNLPSFSRWISETSYRFSSHYSNRIQQIPVLSKILCLLLLIVIFAICIWFIMLSNNNLSNELKQNLSAIEESPVMEIHSVVSVLTFLVAFLIVISTVWTAMALRHNYLSWRRYQMRFTRIDLPTQESIPLSSDTEDNLIRYQSFGIRTPVSPSN